MSARGLVAAIGILVSDANVSVMSLIQTKTSPELLGRVSYTVSAAVPGPLGRSEMGGAGRKAPSMSSATARSAVPKGTLSVRSLRFLGS